MRALPALGLLSLLAPAVGIPSFEVDLDLPPKQRWASIAGQYRQELIAVCQALAPRLQSRFGTAWESWREVVASYDPEFEAELQGMVDAANHSAVTLEVLKLFNMLYELESPVSCSGVLWALPNGTVLHGRNMDYSFHFKMPGGRVLNWPDITFELIFYKMGQPLFRATNFLGGIGVHTGMRFNGWSFEQNTRLGKNEWRANLEAAHQGGQAFPLVVRRVMESTPGFEAAVKELYAAKFMAPSYFIMSGAGHSEGAVLTLDRLGVHDPSTPPIERVDVSPKGWHLVQTNDDLLHLPRDMRRPVANAELAFATQDIITPEHLMWFMRSPPLFNTGTVYSTVMVPATGYYKTIFPDDAVPGWELLGEGPEQRERILRPISAAQASLRGLRKHVPFQWGSESTQPVV